MSDKPIRLTQRAFITPRETNVVTVRGVEWITDRYVIVRADALRSRPKSVADQGCRPVQVRKILDRARGGGVRLTDRCTWTHEPLQGPTDVVLLQGGGRAVAINSDIAKEWMRHEWASVTQDREPFVEFRELRRGRPVLVGLVMPIRLAHTRKAEAA